MTTTTETPTAEAGPDLLGDAARAEQELTAKSLATIRPDQQRFDDDQKAILRQLGIEEATDGDLNLFFHYCRTTGLDPFRKQIYMIGRNTLVKEWVDDDRAQNGRRQIERWVTKYTIQTGIDGYRRNGREAAKRLGDTLTFEGPFFTGEDDFHVDDDGQVIQHWREVWPSGKPPHAAKYVIHRNGEPFPAIAHFDEFVQTAGRDQAPNSMWRKMPRNQIAKCAEALAWRRAYPDDFAGLILEDSSQPTVIDEQGNVERRGGHRSAPAAQPITVEEIFGGDGSGDAAVEAEVVDAEVQESASADGESGQDVGNDQSQGAETSSGATPLPDSGDQPAPAPEPKKAPAKKAAAKKAAAPAEPAAPEQPEKSPMRKALEKRLFALIGDIKPPLDDRADRILLYGQILERTDITSTDDLDDYTIAKVADQLYIWQQQHELDEKVRDLLNSADLAAAVAEEEARTTTTEGK